MRVDLTDVPVDLYAETGIAPGTEIDVQPAANSRMVRIKPGGTAGTALDAYNHLESSDWRLFNSQTLMAYADKEFTHVIVNDNSGT